MLLKNLAFLLCILLVSFTASAYTGAGGITQSDPSADTITKGRYTLVFIERGSHLDPGVRKKMIDAFFAVYPLQAKKYNRKTKRQVVFIIDTSYKGVAATSGSVVRYNPEWFRKHPEDIDVVTHELMHVVQDYGPKGGPGWITEGIADYVRYKMGINNEAANWKLPAYTPKQNFDNSYRVTARFFAWIEKQYDKNFVRKLDRAMREKTYSENFTKDCTGKTFAELWQEYGADPSL
jgi:hypothetical protein